MEERTQKLFGRKLTGGFPGLAVVLLLSCILTLAGCDDGSGNTDPGQKEYTGLEITALPEKTVYALSEDFDATGLVVQKTFPGGSSVPLNTGDYTLSGFNPWRIGTQRITVTCQEQTTDFEVTVNDILHTLPVLAVDTQDRAITSTEVWVTGAGYTLTDTGGAVVTGSLDIKGRGFSTWVFMPKKPYTIKLSVKRALAGMASHKRWALLANYSDKTLLRTETAFNMGKICDNLAWTPDSRQVDFYLNSEYLGVYQLTEAIKIDGSRVNVDEISAANPGGGYILEVDARYGEPFHFTTAHGVAICCSDPDGDLDEAIPGEGRTVFEKIRADVQAAEDALYGDDFTDPAAGWRRYFDAPSFADWYIVNETAKNHDAIFFSSVYFYYDPDIQKYRAGPLWDFDISCGNIDYNGCDNPEGFWIKNDTWITTWISRLFEDPAFVSLVKTRWNAKAAELAATLKFIDSRAGYLAEAQAWNFRRWPILNIYVWPNAVVTGSYSREIVWLKAWLAARLSWLDSAINGL